MVRSLVDIQNFDDIIDDREATYVVNTKKLSLVRYYHAHQGSLG